PKLLLAGGPVDVDLLLRRLARLAYAALVEEYPLRRLGHAAADAVLELGEERLSVFAHGAHCQWMVRPARGAFEGRGSAGAQVAHRQSCTASADVAGADVVVRLHVAREHLPEDGLDRVRGEAVRRNGAEREEVRFGDLRSLREVAREAGRAAL